MLRGSLLRIPHRCKPVRARQLSQHADADGKVWLKSIEERKGICKPDDWYSIKQSELSSDFSVGLKRFYGGNLMNALRDSYPSHNWLEWKFRRVPRGFWKKLENRRRFFLWLVVSKWPEIILEHNDADHRALLSEKVHLLTKEDVYNAGGGSMLLHVYNDAVVDAVHEIFGEDMNLKVWKFSKVPANFWESPQNRRKFIREIAPRLGVTKMEDWYQISSKAVFDLGGRGLLATRYKNSLVLALMDIFNEHKWQPWKFRKVPASWWQSEQNQRALFEAIAVDLGIKSLEEWYGISPSEVYSRAASVIAQHGSVEEALRHLYPDHKFDPWRFIRASKE